MTLRSCVHVRPTGVVELGNPAALAVTLALALALSSFAAKEVGLPLTFAVRHMLAAAFAGASLTSVPFALAVGTSGA